MCKSLSETFFVVTFICLNANKKYLAYTSLDILIFQTTAVQYEKQPTPSEKVYQKYLRLSVCGVSTAAVCCI